MMTLAQALEYARVHHPRMLSGDARVEVARAEARVPRAQWYPTVGATAQLFGATANNTTASYLSSPYVDLPRIGGTRARDAASASWTPYPSTLMAVGVTQEVWDFGRIAAQSAAADALVQVEQHRVDNVWLSVELGVREAFYAVLAAREVVTAADDAYRRAVVHRDLAQAWVAQGMRARTELERVEADVARLDVGRIRARGGLVTARAVFAGAVGLDDAQLDAAGEPGQMAALPSVNEAISHASTHDPIILEMLSRLRAQQARTHAIEAEMRPDIALTAAIDGRSGGAPPTSGDQGPAAGFAPIVPNWNVGIVLQWPVFDATILARRDASQRAEAALHAQVNEVRQAQIAAIQQAWDAVSIAEAAIPALERSVVAAQANQAQVEARFRAGLANSVELADAEALLTEAQIQLALGRFEVARARSGFARVVAEDR